MKEKKKTFEAFLSLQPKVCLNIVWIVKQLSNFVPKKYFWIICQFFLLINFSLLFFVSLFLLNYFYFTFLTFSWKFSSFLNFYGLFISIFYFFLFAEEKWNCIYMGIVLKQFPLFFRVLFSAISDKIKVEFIRKFFLFGFFLVLCGNLMMKFSCFRLKDCRKSVR